MAPQAPGARRPTASWQRRLAKGDRRLIALVDAALAEAAGRAGDRLACRPGCTPCCHGPFPISALDAWRLRAALRRLAARDPALAAAIRERARRAVALLAPSFPGDPRTGQLADGDGAAEAREERFLEQHRDLPCPVLDPDTGTCALYAARPLSCRTFGPPVRIGNERLPPCRLCFVGADPGEVERCRVEIDPDDLEGALLALLAAHGRRGRTLVAYAVLGPEGAVW